MKQMTLALLASLVMLPMSATAESGFVFAGSIGSVTFEDDINALGIDPDATSFRLTAGWQLSDLLTLEAGYHSFGKVDDFVDIGGNFFDVDMRADGFTFGAVLSVPAGRNLSLFGRAGGFVWDAETHINGFHVDWFDDTDAYYGGGAEVAVSDQLSLVGDWTRYEIDGPDSDVISIGIKFRF